MWRSQLKLNKIGLANPNTTFEQLVDEMIESDMELARQRKDDKGKSQMRILITGGTGFLGKHIREAANKTWLCTQGVWAPSSKELNILDRDCLSML